MPRPLYPRRPRGLTAARAPLLFLSLLFPAWTAAPPDAAAQVIREVRVQADNDNFNFWLPPRRRPDFEYTHGARVSLLSASAAGWGRWLDAGRPVCDGSREAERHCLATEWEFGQRIYTPRINSRDRIEGQRPHAGWLYGAMTAIVQGDMDRHSTRVELGVTGPPSLAELMQTTVHEIAGYWEPLGWHNQLPFEPGIVVGYDYARVLSAPEIAGMRAAEVVSRVGVAAGNVVAAGGAGIDARVGINVPRSWGFDEVARASSVSLYLVGGARADAYLRNLFLDGSTGREGPQVDKLPVVQRHHVGVALRIRQADLSYHVTTRSREYRTEPGGHRYSSFVVTVKR